jgi:hypothetical protein
MEAPQAPWPPPTVAGAPSLPGGSGGEVPRPAVTSVEDDINQEVEAKVTPPSLTAGQAAALQSVLRTLAANRGGAAKEVTLQHLHRPVLHRPLSLWIPLASLGSYLLPLLQLSRRLPLSKCHSLLHLNLYTSLLPLLLVHRWPPWLLMVSLDSKMLVKSSSPLLRGLRC